ncbi:hypothetical protein F4804DRAFT_181422 [Jackrogersella minutella]|nr:hypothetical protein F4804DRAFT_181422 [Jackrogersella minutella]
MCDGDRPTCGRCQKTGDTCLYEVNKRDIGQLQLLSDFETARLQSLEVLFGALQNGTDQRAAELLAQIRLGESAETLASALDPSSLYPSASVSYKTPTVAPTSTGPSSMHHDHEDSSTTMMSQDSLDLLLEQNDWYQSTEATSACSNQTTQNGGAGFDPGPAQSL